MSVAEKIATASDSTVSNKKKNVAGENRPSSLSDQEAIKTIGVMIVVININIKESPSTPTA